MAKDSAHTCQWKHTYAGLLRTMALFLPGCHFVTRYIRASWSQRITTFSDKFLGTGNLFLFHTALEVEIQVSILHWRGRSLWKFAASNFFVKNRFLICSISVPHQTTSLEKYHKKHFSELWLQPLYRGGAFRLSPPSWVLLDTRTHCTDFWNALPCIPKCVRIDMHLSLSVTGLNG